MGVSGLNDLIQRKVWLRRNRRHFAGAPSRPQARLLVDISVIRQRDAQTGIQRVVRAVWSELSKYEAGHFDIVPVYADSRHGYCEANVEFLNGGHGRGDHRLVRTQENDVFLGLDLSAQFLPTYRQQLRAWRRHGTKINIVVYDLLPLIRPEFFESKTVSKFKRWFDFVAKESDQIFCISRQVGRDVRDRLRLVQSGDLAPPAIRYLQIGSDMAASRPTKGVSEDVLKLLDRVRFRPAILLVGTVEPRKGYDVALAAFEYLWKNFGGDAPDMIMVGKPGWKTAELQDRLQAHPERGRRLHWVSSVSDEGLCRLYEACRGVLMTSHAEGFGLPLLEAASHSRQVLARDLPVFREHQLPNVSFFEDDEPEALGGAILELAAKGVDRPSTSDLPTWSESVAQLIAELGLGGVDDAFRTLKSVAPTC